MAKEKQEKRPRSLTKTVWVVTRITRIFLRVLANLRIIRVQAYNRKSIPERGSCIIISNHVSRMDPIILWACITRNAAALAKKELWGIPGVGLMMNWMGHVPVARGNTESGKMARDLIAKILSLGGLAIWYPEGTTTGKGPRRIFKRGFAQTAYETGTPVLCTAMVNRGNNHTIESGKRFRWFMPVVVVFDDKLLDPKDFASEAEMIAEAQRRVDALTIQAAAI